MKPLTLFFKAICLCCIIAGIASCKKTDQRQQYSFAYSDFPAVNIGDWWRYRVVDSTANTTDTLKVSVVSATVFSGTRTFNCYISNAAGATIDSATMVLSDTAMTFSSNALLSYKLKLPFSTGDSWSFNFDGDLITAQSYTTGYQVLGQNYNVYDIYRHMVIPDLAVDQHMHIAKGIGLVSEDYQYSSWLPLQRKSVRLIDYYIY